jgi:hypothetical protein
MGHLDDLWWVVFWGCFGAGAEWVERGAKSLLFVAFGREERRPWDVRAGGVVVSLSTMNEKNTMLVNEIFYSLQGEGVHMGKASIFIRLSRCNLRCSFCDTEFDSGVEMTLEEIRDAIAVYPGRSIIWTGGEPTLQLTDEVVAYFKALGYYQSIETNGTRRPPRGLDYITCSPKREAMRLLHQNFPEGVGEFRFPIGRDIDLPPAISDLPPAGAYLVSPIFVGETQNDVDREAVELCVKYVLEHPEWQLSLQMHKLIHIP